MSFEIHPDIRAGGVETIPYLESLGYSNAPRLYDGIRQHAREVGITIGPVPHKYNTHLSLLLTEYAKEQEKVREYNQAVFRAFWSDSRDISDPAVLEQIMTVIGLDFTAAIIGVKSGEYDRRFEEEKALARQLRITAVPAFIFDDKYLISGAQPVEVFRRVLRETAASIAVSAPPSITYS
jgi:predicted DsbA family dithiol-disulfide isomerase